MIPPLLGFAKQGMAEGKLLYVNYGTSDDFKVLRDNFTISNCSGYIVIMRYGKIFRGDKVTSNNLHLNLTRLINILPLSSTNYYHQIPTVILWSQLPYHIHIFMDK
jgi:hypothetical protein